MTINFLIVYLILTCIGNYPIIFKILALYDFKIFLKRKILIFPISKEPVLVTKGVVTVLSIILICRQVLFFLKYLLCTLHNIE